MRKCIAEVKSIAALNVRGNFETHHYIWLNGSLLMRQLNEGPYPCCFLNHNSLISILIHRVTREQQPNRTQEARSPAVPLQMPFCSACTEVCVQWTLIVNYVKHPSPSSVGPYTGVHSACLKDLFAQEGVSKVQTKFASQWIILYQNLMPQA